MPMTSYPRRDLAPATANTKPMPQHPLGSAADDSRAMADYHRGAADHFRSRDEHGIAAGHDALADKHEKRAARGATLHDAVDDEEVTMSQELQPGDRVRIDSSGETGRVRSVDGQYLTVDEDSGYSTRLAAHGVTKMSNDFAAAEVAMARTAQCPYCSKNVIMSRGALGDHRVPGGICDGARQKVARIELGRAVLMDTRYRLTDKAFKVLADACQPAGAASYLNTAETKSLVSQGLIAADGEYKYRATPEGRRVWLQG